MVRTKPHIRMHAHTHTYTHIDTYIHTYTHIYIHGYTHTHAHTYTHIYTYTYTLTYTHTAGPSPCLSLCHIVSKQATPRHSSVSLSCSFFCYCLCVRVCSLWSGVAVAHNARAALILNPHHVPPLGKKMTSPRNPPRPDASRPATTLSHHQ